MKLVEKRPLNFERMNDLDLWRRIFIFLQWCVVPAVLVFFYAVANELFWYFGQEASRLYPIENSLAQNDIRYVLWHYPGACFTAGLSMVASVTIVRLFYAKVIHSPGNAKAIKSWSHPVAASADLTKLFVSTVVLTAAMLYLSFLLRDLQLPRILRFLQPPSTIEYGFVPWLKTRGILYFLFGLGSVLVAQFGFRMHRGRVLPENGFLACWFLLFYVVCFELLYTFVGPYVEASFLTTYAQSFLGLRLAIEAVVTVALLSGTVYFLCMAKGLRTMPPATPFLAKIAILGASSVGKTRLFGEALMELVRLQPNGMKISLEESQAFYDRYQESRKKLNLQGTTKPEELTFSLYGDNRKFEKLQGDDARFTSEISDRKLVRFTWVDPPGGYFTSGADQSSPDFADRQAFDQYLRSAHALFLAFDSQLLVKAKDISRYPYYKSYWDAILDYVERVESESLQNNSYARPPILCIVATKLDETRGKKRYLNRELHKLVKHFNACVANTGLTRSYVRVYLTSALNSYTKLESGEIDDIESMGCSQAVNWVTARIIEARSVGLDVLSSVALGRQTPTGELQVVLDDNS